MKNNCLYFILFVLLLGACTDKDLGQVEMNAETTKVQLPFDVIEGELLIKFNSNMAEVLDQALSSRSLSSRSGISSTDEILDILNTYHFERVFPVNPKTEERTREAGLHLWYIIRFDKDINLDNAIEQLSLLGEISKVQCNRKIQKSYQQCKSSFIEGKATMGTRSIDSQPFNDPDLCRQWGYINRGGYDFAKEWAKTIAGSDVNCKEAWEKCTGNPSIIVAVMDEGVMWNHPDLEANIWVNENEIYGDDNDNDNNGYKGDRYGYNFASDRGYISTTGSNDTGHGTHVAGTIAAVNGNGLGVCGIAGGDWSKGQAGVKIMSCQIFDDTYAATVAMEAKAVKYAADNGAVVLQCSWGYNSSLANIMLGYTPGPASEEEWVATYPLEKEAFDYFIKNAGSPNGTIDGGIVVFASGNEYAAMPAYPGAYSKCICVSAIAADYTPATYTNYGVEVDLSAPGGDSEYYGTPGQDGDEGGMIYSTWVNNGQPSYGYYDGTSMACPHVSGVAALGLSYAAQLCRHFKAEEFIELMKNSALNIDNYFIGNKQSHYNHSSPGYSVTTKDLNEYKGKMGRLVDAASLLRAIENSGSDMKIPNIYVAPGNFVTLDLSRYYINGENLTYSCTVNNNSIATANIVGTTMNVNGLEIGTTSATIKINNGKEQTIIITVRNNASNNGWM